MKEVTVGYSFEHFVVDSYVGGFSDKSIRVEIDGETKFLPLSRMKSVCLESSGDIEINIFKALLEKKGLPKGKLVSVEMDKWIADRNGLEKVKE